MSRWTPAGGTCQSPDMNSTITTNLAPAGATIPLHIAFGIGALPGCDMQQTLRAGLYAPLGALRATLANPMPGSAGIVDEDSAGLTAPLSVLPDPQPFCCISHSGLRLPSWRHATEWKHKHACSTRSPSGAGSNIRASARGNRLPLYPHGFVNAQ
jgi:hypothetical protein